MAHSVKNVAHWFNGSVWCVQVQPSLDDYHEYSKQGLLGVDWMLARKRFGIDGLKGLVFRLACSPSTPSLFSVIMPFMQNSWGYAGLSCPISSSLCAGHKFLIIDICVSSSVSSSVSSTVLSKEDLEKGHYFGFATWPCCHLKPSVSTLLQMDSKCYKLALSGLLLAKPLAEVSGAWRRLPSAGNWALAVACSIGRSSCSCRAFSLQAFGLATYLKDGLLLEHEVINTGDLDLVVKVCLMDKW